MYTNYNTTMIYGGGYGYTTYGGWLPSLSAIVRIVSKGMTVLSTILKSATISTRGFITSLGSKQQSVVLSTSRQSSAVIQSKQQTPTPL